MRPHVADGGPTMNLDTGRSKVLPGCNDKDPDSIPLPHNRNPRLRNFRHCRVHPDYAPDPIRIP
jgi:hypothetical protein